MPSRVLARRIAALDTCRVLHQAQELDDNLVPVGKESFRVREEEEEATLALEELDEAIPRDSAEPRPGTTKRRQYYYKRVGAVERVYVMYRLTRVSVSPSRSMVLC
jgi:endoribonuclease Dicer